jgi:hypothetical protein
MLVEVRDSPGTAGAAAPSMFADRSITVNRIRSDGSLVAPVGSFPGGNRDFTFARTVNAFPQGGSIYAGDGRANEFGVYSMTGKLLRIVRWKDELLPITREMAEKSGPRPAAGSGASMPAIPPRPAGSTLPAYRRIQVDAGGRVWIEDYRTGRDVAGWTVFDPSGLLLGRVDVPKLGEYLELVSVGRDQVSIRWRDTDGAPHLSYHSLIR